MNTQGRYVFKKTSLATREENERFMFVRKSLHDSGGVKIKYWEEGEDLVLIFEKELGCNPETRHTRHNYLPAPLSLKQCLKKQKEAPRNEEAYWMEMVRLASERDARKLPKQAEAA